MDRAESRFPVVIATSVTRLLRRPVESAEGSPIELSPNAAISFAMALHELATNAVKHGALSVPEGEATLRWRTDRGAGGGGKVLLEWVDRGGPKVTPPARNGFGSRLLEKGVARELGGAVTLEFREEGLIRAMEFPLNGKLRLG